MARLIIGENSVWGYYYQPTFDPKEAEQAKKELDDLKKRLEQSEKENIA